MGNDSNRYFQRKSQIFEEDTAPCSLYRSRAAHVRARRYEFGGDVSLSSAGRMRATMTSVNPNGFTTWSDVLVGDDGYLYFRGTDNAVWRVNPSNPADNTNFGGPDVIATQSSVVAVGGYMYLRGTDDKVWRVNIHNPDPNNPGRVNLGGFTTWSDVLVGDDGYLYFRGTDNAVWRVNPSNPADNTNFGGPGVIATQSNVVAVGGYMYLRGTDDAVWRVNIHNPDPNHPQMLNPLHLEGDSRGFVTQSNVNCSRGIMYFRGTDDKVWETDGVPYPNPSGFGDAVTVPSAPRIYIENTDPRRIDNLDLVLTYSADFGVEASPLPASENLHKSGS
jgi:hypothetical protein